MHVIRAVVWTPVLLCAGDADVASIATSDESFTTDDGEDSTTVGGKQTWTMSFEWQDGSADNAPDPSATFEESTDFDQPSSHCTHQTTMGTSGSSCEASDPSPVNSDHDWLQPWSGSSVGIPRTYGQDHSKTHQHRKESQPKPKAEPMSDEHKTAILGNFSTLFLYACLFVLGAYLCRHKGETARANTCAVIACSTSCQSLTNCTAACQKHASCLITKLLVFWLFPAGSGPTGL